MTGKVALILQLILITLVFSPRSFFYSHPDMQTLRASYDAGTFCPAFQVSAQDAKLHALDRNTIELTANINERGGAFVNSLIGYGLPLYNGHIYVSEVYVQIPPDAQNEVVDVNLQLIMDGVEYHAEILWTMNPYSPLHEKVWTRFDDLSKEHIITTLKRDTLWHLFRVKAYYNLEKDQAIYLSAQIDDHTFAINRPMGRLDRTGIPYSHDGFIFLMETTNQYTACDNNIMTVGKSRWRDARTIIQ